jgi:hypothetical protein
VWKYCYMFQPCWVIRQSLYEYVPHYWIIYWYGPKSVIYKFLLSLCYLTVKLHYILYIIVEILNLTESTERQKENWYKHIVACCLCNTIIKFTQVSDLVNMFIGQSPLHFHVQSPSTYNVVRHFSQHCFCYSRSQTELFSATSRTQPTVNCLVPSKLNFYNLVSDRIERTM